MEVSATAVARIPAGNIKVLRQDFAAVWREAEHRNEVMGERGESDWFNAGVAVTCRWLAATDVRPPDGRWYLAPSPITRRTSRAYEELIVAEYYEAEKLALRKPTPTWLQRRPGWVEGILATLSWAWRRTGEPPIGINRM